MKDLIGKKVKGFKFEDRSGLYHTKPMDEYIGKVGKIIKYLERYNSYRVQFKDEFCHYPAELIESHLVDEWVIGEEYEFSFGNGTWEKSELLAILPKSFKRRYVCKYSEDDTINFSHIRSIENREILYQIEVLEKELSNLKSKIK